MPVIEKDRNSGSAVTTATLRVMALALLIALGATLVIATVTFVDGPVAVSLVSAAGVSLLAGVLAALGPHAPADPGSMRPHVYARRLDELTTALRRPSRELDRLLDELTAVTAERQSAVDALTGRLAALTMQEQELRQRNDELLKVSIPAIAAFAAISSESEKRSERRDYLLFGAGAAVSTAVSMIISVLQGI